MEATELSEASVHEVVSVCIMHLTATSKKTTIRDLQLLDIGKCMAELVVIV